MLLRSLAAAWLLLHAASIVRAQPNDHELRVAEIMLLHQRNNGGWPKNYDEDIELTEERRESLAAERGREDTTFDNGATHRETTRLAHLFVETGDQRYRVAAERGVEFMLLAQYDSGGWPQFYPDTSGYRKQIAFNDGAMIGVLTLLRDVAREEPEYQFLPAQFGERARKAVDRGVDCILRCQIERDGEKTAWCAQHDRDTFLPALARSYELPSVSGSESVGIVRFLMGIERPSEEVVEAIQAAVAWFDGARLEGIRQVRRADAATSRGWDKILVADPTAPPLWARFYDLRTNQPIFCSRDGVPRATLAEISYERRTGYSWLGEYARDLLAKDYPAWCERVAAPSVLH